jgi:signal recognition particle subunit SEC65
MFPFFNEEDLICLFKKWASDTEKYAVKKAKSEECRKRLKEAEISFIKKQEELFKRKREMDKSAYMTADERDEIRRPFREVRRRIEKEIYRDFESKP